jgi:chromosome partitioning protein
MNGSAAQAGKRTLLIDLDPQAQATVIYGPQIPHDRTVKAIFAHRTAERGGFMMPAEVHERPIEHLSIVPSSIHLALTAKRLLSQHYRERRLHTQLAKLGNGSDDIRLDGPPNLGVITVNAISTADWVLIPTTYGRYFLDGIADRFASIAHIRAGPRACWMLRKAFDSRTSATHDYIEKPRATGRSYVLNTIIRTRAAINQAQLSGEPGFTYAPKGYGAQDFHALTTEVMRHG